MAEADTIGEVLTDVEHSDKLLRLLDSGSILAEQALVDYRDEVLPDARVHKLGHTVSDNRSGWSSQGGDDLLAPGHELLLDRPLLEVSRRDPEQAGRELERRVVVRHQSLGPRLGDLDVSEVEQSGEQSEDLPLLLDGDADGRERLLGDVKLSRVVHAWDRGRLGSSLVEVEELCRVHVEAEVLALLGRRTRT